MLRSTGAVEQDIAAYHTGLVGRGVLLDIPRFRGVKWLEPGEAVTRAELEACAEAEGVAIGEGDILVLRTGHHRRRLELGPWNNSPPPVGEGKAGLHVDAIPWMHERRIAAFLPDGDGEAVPSVVEGITYPIHPLQVAAMGMLVSDSLQFEELREQVLAANLELAARGLAHASFGNVSGVDRDAGVVAIKPSGVGYSELRAERIALVSLESGEHLAGLRPSSDTPTHLELYRALDAICGIAHTHSVYATSWAQARRSIPCLGTTHADYVYGPVPCTRPLSDEECRGDYERLTGSAIVEALGGRDPLEVPGVLVASHGVFTWAGSAAEAVEQASALELIAQLAFNSVVLGGEVEPVSEALLDRHFRRKHGPTAYYGQR